MALRDEKSASHHKNENQSSLSGLQNYWNEGELKPSLEWPRWMDLFGGAVMAKHGIDVHKMTRNTPPDREKELMGGSTFEAASRKLVSVLFLSLGMTARKSLMDLRTHMRIAEVLI